jgi:phage shock protein E
MAKVKRTNILLYVGIALAIVFAIFIYQAYRYAMDSPLRIDAAAAKAKIQQHEYDVILDVRTEAEVALLGYYPGAIRIPSSDIDKVVPMEIPDKHSRILAYCNSGQRARKAAEKLKGMGYVNVQYIATTYRSLM